MKSRPHCNVYALFQAYLAETAHKHYSEVFFYVANLFTGYFLSIFTQFLCAALGTFLCSTAFYPTTPFVGHR